MRFPLLFFAISLLFTTPLLSAESTEECYQRIYAELNYCGNGETSRSERAVMAAEGMLSTPYIEGSLERGEGEALTVDLTATDCILFIESVVALTLCSYDSFAHYPYFCDYIRSLRYRDGVIGDYSSRIHYTSEWIAQGEQSGYFREITKEIGGEPKEQHFSFMSSHANLYKQLREDKQQVEKIALIEESLTSMGEYYIVPKGSVAQVTPLLRSGDIVAFTTSVEGLDIAHIGMVYIVGERITFIHASSAAGEVIIHPTSIEEYVASRRSISGIRVIRL